MVNENHEGGLSSDIMQDEKADHLSLPVETPVSLQVENMAPGIEERISRLEGLTLNIDSKLDTLIKKRDGRDKTIVELNKMIMDSLKRHANTLKQFRNFREKMSQEIKSRTKA